jgi:hypothetical protein
MAQCTLYITPKTNLNPLPHSLTVIVLCSRLQLFAFDGGISVLRKQFMPQHRGTAYSALQEFTAAQLAPRGEAITFSTLPNPPCTHSCRGALIYYVHFHTTFAFSYGVGCDRIMGWVEAWSGQSWAVNYHCSLKHIASSQTHTGRPVSQQIPSLANTFRLE